MWQTENTSFLTSLAAYAVWASGQIFRLHNVPIGLKDALKVLSGTVYEPDT